MATERQAGIPGGPYVNETPPPREAGVPGGGFLNETTEAAAASGLSIPVAMANYRRNRQRA